MRKIFDYLNEHETGFAHLLTIAGLVVVCYQLYQGNEHKRWENYNSMNLRYYELYTNIPEELETDSCEQFSAQDKKIKVWVRSYFNLYSEEYWLYLEGLMPKEMWEIRIDNGVDVNLVNYPLLVRGYEYWKKEGSFIHPEGFIPLVDGKIQRLKEKIKSQKCE